MFQIKVRNQEIWVPIQGITPTLPPENLKGDGGDRKKKLKLNRVLYENEA